MVVNQSINHSPLILLCHHAWASGGRGNGIFPLNFGHIVLNYSCLLGPNLVLTMNG